MRFSSIPLLLTLLLLAALATHAQPTVQWDKTLRGQVGGASIQPTIRQTMDGGLIVGGSSDAQAGNLKSEDSRSFGNYDFWVIKLDVNRDKEWDKTLGGIGHDNLSCLQQTADGGYILAGQSGSDIGFEKSENNRGAGDYWVVKLDENGNRKWDKTFGGNKDDLLTSVQQTADGGYILGGYSISDADIAGGKSENSRGDFDYWVLKLDANGNMQWDKTLGGSGADRLSSLQQTNDGGYILGGYSSSNADNEKSENSRGSGDFWIVKLDGNGNRQWDKTLGGAAGDFLMALRQTADGGYIVGGQSWSEAGYEKSESPRGGIGDNDWWIVKLDANGSKQWDRTLGGYNAEGFSALQQTADGGYLLGGSSMSSAGGDKREDRRGGTDYWVVRLDADGIKLWDKTIGGTDEDKLSFLQQTSDGGYILAGESGSDIGFEKSEKSWGVFASDYWIVKLCDTPPKPELGPDRPWCRWTDQNANDPAYPPAANNPVLTGPAGSLLAYRWWRNGSELTSQTNRTLPIDKPGEYVLEVKNGCGNTARDTVILTRYDEVQPFSLTSTSEPRLCPGETQTWVGPSGDFAYTWEWARDPDFSQVIATTRQIALTQPGTYRLTAIDSCGNYYRDSVVITQQADPSTLSLNLPPLYDRCLQASSPLQLPADLGLAYRWTSEDGSLLSEEPVFLPPSGQGGTLTLQISDRCGRSATAKVEVIDPEASAVHRWGTAFSPNADGLHDTYPPASYLDGAYRLQVFNRWGQLVYTGSQPWRGTDGNTDAPEGSYVVHIQVPDCQGGTRELIRTVTVIR
ncbi:MAG: gliding motility-associated C-terminal domain-containing protein [Bacteroidetes bacterium]|nr:gliding motility-associated C-terminal domain-containing protein [Bacteroidota bacterium]